MRKVTPRAAAVAAAVTAATATAVLVPANAQARAPQRHVLLLSVDGMHQSDLDWYVAHHPDSALAALVGTGSEFTAAQTPFPSDSFPGMVGIATGGNPKTTGVYYDVSFNDSLIDPSASTSAVPSRQTCTTAPRGANVDYDESIDTDLSRLDAGQGLPGLPGSILRMTGDPRSVIDPTALPIDPTTCTRVYPHAYLRVNTIFDVVHDAGLRTAWSDKHPAYEILDGPTGNGVDDLFTPEINSIADSAGDDWTQVNSLTQQYDGYKVQAVLNEIHGEDHSGQTTVGEPAIFGMNFQSVSTAQKMPTSGGQAGGYSADGITPGPVLQNALGFVDREVGAMQTALRKTGEDRSTDLVLTSKHGQAPTDGQALKRIADGTIIDGLDAAYAKAFPSSKQPLVAAASDDDGMLLWFSAGNRTAAADAFAQRYLQDYDGSGTGTDGLAKSTDLAGAPVAYTSAGLRAVYAGAAAAQYIGTSTSDPRVPDLIGLGQHGVVYTGKTSKIAEHGGDDPQDRNVPLVVAGPSVTHGVHGETVETTQVAPTILALLHLDPQALQAVQLEGTAALPLGR